MEIFYCNYRFNLHFDEPIFFALEPIFIFRSVLGKHLHDLSCIRKNSKCGECSLAHHCAYALIFETPLLTESIELKGRKLGAHPFVMSLCKTDGEIFETDKAYNGSIQDFHLNFVLLESSIPQFAYIFTSIYNAGKEGIFRERKKFKIESVQTAVDTYYPNGDSIRISPFLQKWETDLDDSMFSKSIDISFLTPFRMLDSGSLATPLNAYHIINSATRRLKILCELYGHEYIPFSYDKRFLQEPYMRVDERSLSWRESNRYSAKQDTVMLLGGVVGKMKLSGMFAKSMLDILEGANIFNIGKNTSFGFGKVKVDIY